MGENFNVLFSIPPPPTTSSLIRGLIELFDYSNVVSHSSNVLCAPLDQVKSSIKMF